MKEHQDFQKKLPAILNLLASSPSGKKWSVIKRENSLVGHEKEV